ncbi:MAG: metallophosphoesterase [Pseudomonadales bacterium]
MTLDFEQGVKNQPAALQQSVTLSGLRPDTTYHYNVDNKFIGSFHTHGSTEKFRFAALGHTHGSEGFSQYPERLLMARIAELDPEFVVHMGDATYFSNPEDYREFLFRPFAETMSRVPLYLAPGNHDAGWPFLFGSDLTNFKALFDYPYPAEIRDVKEEAYYSIAKGDMQFLFLSYTSPLGPESKQRKWLKKTLTNSTYAFNVAVFGGAQKPYYNRESLLDFLVSLGVNLILTGDGSDNANPYLRYHKKVPLLFVGTNGRNAHSFLYLIREAEHLRIKRMSATGKLQSNHWIYSPLPRKKVQGLSVDNPAVKNNGRRVSYTTEFDVPLESGSVSGIHLSLDAIEGQRALVYAYVTPSDAPPKSSRNEGGYRTQYHHFTEKTDTHVLLPLLATDPLRQKPYRISKIRVVVETQGGKGEGVTIEDMYLY